MAGTRIPRDINRFSDYIVDTDDYLQEIINPGPPAETNWSRLGLTQAEADEWHTRREAWDSVFPHYSNLAYRTRAVTAEVKLFMESFIAVATLTMNRKIAVSQNANSQDALTFNFKLVRKHPTHPTTPIAENCFADVQSLGGGMVRVACRTISDAKRPSMAKNANIVQVAYKVGGTPPVTPKDGTQLTILGKADIIHPLGEEIAGQRVYAFFRWANTKYPHLSGPYSDPVSFIVS